MERLKMDFKLYEDKFYQGYSLIVFGLLILMYKFTINPSNELFYTTIGLLTIPGIFITVFAVSKVRLSIRTFYGKRRKELEMEIDGLRRKQETMGYNKEVIKIDEKILRLRETLVGLQNNRFIKNILFSFIALIVTLVIYMFNIGKLINIETRFIMFVSFAIGLYYIFKTLIELLIIFQNN